MEDFLEAVVFLGASYAAIKVALVVFSILAAIYALFFRARVNVAKYGQWAVVTGATDGIGKELAMELARRKMKVALLSRSADKLDAVKKEIEAATGAEVKVIVADFSKPEGLYERLEAELKPLGDIGILVNNVGVSYDYPEYFDKLPAQRVDDLVSLNIVSINKMTRIVLPGMIDRKRGAIINVSSFSGTITCPLLAEYSASKAYADFFSRALALEYAAKGVFVQSLVPFFVESKLSKLRKSFTTPSAKAYARSALATLGHEHRTGGYWVHDIVIYIFAVLPEWAVGKIVSAQHLGIRARALRKAEREAKAK